MDPANGTESHSAPERYINSDAIDAIVIRIVRTALADYRANRYCPGKPDAAAFLIAAGIVNPATGAIDYHGYSKVRKPAHAAARRAVGTTRED